MTQNQISKTKICKLRILYNELNNNGELNLVPKICQKGLPKIASELDSLLDTKALDARVIGSTIFMTFIKRDHQVYYPKCTGQLTCYFDNDDKRYPNTYSLRECSHLFNLNERKVDNW